MHVYRILGNSQSFNLIGTRGTQGIMVGHKRDIRAAGPLARPPHRQRLTFLDYPVV